MDDLIELYEELLFKNIRTYIQSGNVVFQSQKSELKNLGTKISNQIQKYFGFEVQVIVLEIEELKRIIRDNPYTAIKNIDISRVYITFLATVPDQVSEEISKQKHTSGDMFALIGKTIYLYCPNGYGRTKLTNTFFENKLKVVATTRNWKTTIELLNIAENIAGTKK
jgi:uncharacterized protein (DUF1697 family)